MPTTMTRRFMLACVLTATFAAAGCENPGGASGGRRGSGGTGDAFAAGKKVPSDARQIDQSTNGRIMKRAQRPGSIWLEDTTTGKVIYSGKVRADSNVVIDARADAVTVNDQQARHAPSLDPDHKYRLYFKGE